LVRVFGLERPGGGETIMPELTTRYGRALAAHFDDQLLDGPSADGDGTLDKE